MNPLGYGLLAALVLFPVSAAHAQGTVNGAPPAEPAAPVLKQGITATGAYAFATGGEAEAAAVFLTLTYPPGDQPVPDRLIAVSTPVAEKAELHTMTMDENNVMAMRPLGAPLPLPPTGIFVLKPTGTHIMLSGLNQRLRPGDKFPVTLTFERGGTVTTDVLVRRAGDLPSAPAMPGMDSGMDMSGHGHQ